MSTEVSECEQPSAHDLNGVIGTEEHSSYLMGDSSESKPIAVT